jgi:hypothetical protein
MATAILLSALNLTILDATQMSENVAFIFLYLLHFT